MILINSIGTALFLSIIRKYSDGLYFNFC
nr:hypothetical protein [Streptococcus pneumoniae]